MQLQISTHRYSATQESMRDSGIVQVYGEGVQALFSFGPVFGCDEAGAGAQARFFMASGLMLEVLRDLLEKLEAFEPGFMWMSVGRIKDAIAYAEGRA